MNQSKWAKFAPLSGVLAAVLLLIGTFFYDWNFLPTPDQAAATFANSGRLTLVIVFGGASMFFFMWFAGSVYHSLREKEGGTGRLSILAFGGGLGVGLFVGLSFTLIMAGMSRAGSAGGIDPIIAAFLYDLWGVTAWSMVSFCFVIFIAATALASQRYAILPAWFHWLSWITVVGLVTPLYWAVTGLAIVWVVVLSVMLYRREA
jgi:hypothetical protein